MINDNTTSQSLLAANSSLFQFGEGEATTFTDFTVVANGLATDGWAEEGEGADAESGGFGFAGVAAAEFSSGLVEPCAYPALPVLVEVVAVEDWRDDLVLALCSLMSELTVVVPETHGLV